MLKWPAFYVAQGLQMVRSILDDLLTVQRISAVPAILQVVSETTGCASLRSPASPSRTGPPAPCSIASSSV